MADKIVHNLFLAFGRISNVVEQIPSSEADSYSASQ